MEVPAKRGTGSQTPAGTRPGEVGDPLRGRGSGLGSPLADRHVTGDLAPAGSRLAAAPRNREQLWDLDVAEARFEKWAPRMERASGRKPEQARDLGTSQLDAPLRTRDIGVGFGDGRDESCRVRMRRVGDQGLGVGELDDPPEIHDPDAPDAS